MLAQIQLRSAKKTHKFPIMRIRAYFCFTFLMVFAFFVKAEVQWQAEVDCGSLFPSFIISTATLNLEKAKRPSYYFGDLNGQVGCTVISPQDDYP
jgi:hypothetical protein